MEYVCPMHPEIIRNKKGRCPKCGMWLVEKGSKKTDGASSDIQNSYKPLVVIVLLITTVSLLVSSAHQNFLFRNFVSNFMIGFFVVFSGFKLMDLKGFAEGYSTYDLLAKKWFGYGYIYPFIELIFGFCMILNIGGIKLLWAEVIVMAFSGLGVAIKLAKKEKFQCSCLGTFLKVPLTNVTLIEDFGMSVLALFLLLYK